MNIRDALHQELKRLDQAKVTGQCTLAASDTGGTVSCELVALDGIGCAFDQLTYHTSRLADASLDQLRALSEDLSRRLCYLLEPIRPLEIDIDRCQIQMRSNPPQKDENGNSYYELLVEKGGQISLCRYQKAPGQPRQNVPAYVTREVLLRLASDFAAVP